MRAIPRFNSDFLNDVAEAFQRRGRAISTHGRLKIRSSEQGATDALEISCSLLVGPAVILVISPSAASLYLRHTGNRQRGKVFLRWEDLVLTPDAAEIVRAFEETMSHAHGFDAVNMNPRVADAIRSTWSQLLTT